MKKMILFYVPDFMGRGFPLSSGTKAGIYKNNEIILHLNRNAANFPRQCNAPNKNLAQLKTTSLP